MTEENLQKLIKELVRDEGMILNPYLDSVGIQTVGVGHNLKANPLPKTTKFPLTETQALELLRQDIQKTFSDLDMSIPWWKTLDEVRQRVIANMCFNLGINGLLKFNRTLAAVKAGRYDQAAAGMLESLWAKQVKGRATRLADGMKKGVM